jgi:predicted phage gp36 major capsid-like protein
VGRLHRLRLSGLRITRDEVTNPGYTRFYVRRREGGIVLNNNAAKFLKV